MFGRKAKAKPGDEDFLAPKSLKDLKRMFPGVDPELIEATWELYVGAAVGQLLLVGSTKKFEDVAQAFTEFLYRCIEISAGDLDRPEFEQLKFELVEFDTDPNNHTYH